MAPAAAARGKRAAGFLRRACQSVSCPANGEERTASSQQHFIWVLESFDLVALGADGALDISILKTSRLSAVRCSATEPVWSFTAFRPSESAARKHGHENPTSGLSELAVFADLFFVGEKAGISGRGRQATQKSNH
jgi:hypothetical protein